MRSVREHRSQDVWCWLRVQSSCRQRSLHTQARAEYGAARARQATQVTAGRLREISIRWNR